MTQGWEPSRIEGPGGLAQSSVRVAGGGSAGEPRQDVNHWRHREDYHAAIATARARPGVDPARIAVWGSSYSGGHVIAVAAEDQTIGAVISQGAAVDGLKALQRMGDRIALLQDGTVVAGGRHARLLQESPAYRGVVARGLERTAADGPGDD